jgi:hypothetical protein
MAHNFASRPTSPAVALPQLSLGVSAPGAATSASGPGAAPVPASVLAKGTLVKVGISWLVDHTLVVVSDPGPAGRGDRRVTVKRQEPERRHESYSVRRDNVSLPRERA